jgi:hypothetical protein
MFDGKLLYTRNSARLDEAACQFAKEAIEPAHGAYENMRIIGKL